MRLSAAWLSVSSSLPGDRQVERRKIRRFVVQPPNRAATRIKVLCCDAQGTWLAVRRLQDGRFIWPASGATTWSLDPEQFGWLCAGVDWQRLSPQKRLAPRV